MRLLREGADEPGRYPCAVPLRPAYGRYLAWIESRDLVSSTVLRVDHHETSGEQQILSPLVSAARVTIPAQGLDPEFRLVVLPFRLELPVKAALKEPLVVPAGRLVVVVFDRRGEVAQISRPLIATPRKTVTADFRTGEKADLVAMIDAPAPLPEDPILAAGERQADWFVPDGERSLAIWYGLEPGSARISLRSERLFMNPQETRLRRGSLAVIHAALRMRPALTVHVQASNSDAKHLLEAKAKLRVLAEGDGRVLKETELGESMSHRFELLPPEIVQAALQIDSWTIRTRVDLTPAIDSEATIEVEPLNVSGVVTYGGERVPARLQFRRADESISTETDDTGEYELMLWQPGRFVVEVWVSGRADAASHQDFVRIDESTTTLDVRIPRNSYRVRVVDAGTGEPIARSMVTSLNTWMDAKEGRRRSGRPVFTDARGIAELPPLRAGEVEIHAAADGYFEAEAVTLAVPEGEPADSQPIEFRLRPMGETQRVRLILPDGSPASGARLLAIAGSRVLWQGLAGADGAVDTPAAVDGSVLLVRHPAAGSLVRRWTRSQPEPLALPPAAAPMVVKATRAGNEPARFAQVTAWIDGIAVDSIGLTFLTGESASTDGDGIWTGRNLPAASIRIVATSRRAADAQTLEPLATRIDHPWPSPVLLRVVE